MTFCFLKWDQEVQGVEITSFEVDKDKTITVKLNREVQDIRFKLNGVLVDYSQDTTDKTIYKINGSSQILENKENILLITDESDTFEQSKKFVYRVLTGPESVIVSAGAGNKAGEINSSNVKNVNLNVAFKGGNTNVLPVTLEVTITDSAKKPNTLTLTKELTANNINETITGDFSRRFFIYFSFSKRQRR